MTVEKDKYSARVVPMEFRVARKDRGPGCPEHEVLRVLVEGREGGHWVGLLLDAPRYASQPRKGCPIWLRQADVERSRPLEPLEIEELGSAAFCVALTGRMPAQAN